MRAADIFFSLFWLAGAIVLMYVGISSNDPTFALPVALWSFNCGRYFNKACAL